MIPKKALILGIISLLTFSLSACTSDNKTALPSSEVYQYSDTGKTDFYAYDIGENKAEDSEVFENEATVTSSREKKIVTSAAMILIVKSCDETEGKIRELVERTGGYTETSEFNRHTYKEREYETGNMVLRVPAEQYKTAIAELKTFGSVSSFSEGTTDRTVQFYDIQRRCELKVAEEAALVAMTEKAANVKELIDIEARLSEVRAEIESYNAQMNEINDLASYSTIELTINEEADVTIRPVSGNLLSKIGNGFKTSVNGIVWFLESSVVFLVMISVPLMLLAVIVSIGVLIYKKANKKESGKQENTKARKKTKKTKCVTETERKTQ